MDEPVGRVLRASTESFSAGARAEMLNVPPFGQVVKVQPREEGRAVIYGLLYDTRIDDDPMVRQLVLADTVSEEMVRDQRMHRITPVEMSVLCIGYLSAQGVRHTLPPHPAMSLDAVHMCTSQEVRAVTERFDYFRLVLNSGMVPSEQLLAAHLLLSSETHDNEQDQYAYLVEAGREIARLLSNDLPRLDNLLRLIYPM
ncbi:MAG: hypothetical protein GYB64_04670 [Chloroflexi bacterium]|nr:hypothetical protein [Chloroflexota bacterium]